MWRMFNNAMIPAHKVSYSFFWTVFNHDFNLGFGNPRVDTCTTCENLQNRLKISNLNTKEKERYMSEKRIHRLRYESFYQLLRESRHSSFTLVFDLQAVHYLPKLTIQETYYSRQLALYNLGMCCLNSNKNYSYTWLECESARGANEICSALINLLERLQDTDEFKSAKKLRLFCDGCGGQNKNNIVLGALQHWLSSKKFFDDIELVFPVRGHSYLPCDRLFGRISKELRRMDTIYFPQEYHAVFSRHVDQVFVLGEHWCVRDFRSMTRATFKPLKSIQQCKRLLISLKEVEVWVTPELFYRSNTGYRQSLLQKGKSWDSILAADIVPPRRQIDHRKIKDIHGLLDAALGTDWSSNPVYSLYKDLQNGEVEDDKPEAVCQCASNDIGLRI